MSDEIALSINDENQVLTVGDCIHFGYCSKVINGQRCDNVINTNDGDLCAKHLKASVNKYMSRRNETNRTQMRTLKTNKRIKSLSGNNGIFISNNKSFSVQKERKVRKITRKALTAKKTKQMKRINSNNNIKKTSRGYTQLTAIMAHNKQARVKEMTKGNKNILPVLGKQLNDANDDIQLILDDEKKDQTKILKKINLNNPSNKSNKSTLLGLRSGIQKRKRRFDVAFAKENQSKQATQFLNEIKKRKIDKENTNIIHNIDTNNNDNSKVTNEGNNIKPEMKIPKPIAIKTYKCSNTKCSMVFIYI